MTARLATGGAAWRRHMINKSTSLANTVKCGLIVAALVLTLCLCVEGRARNGAPAVSPAATATTAQVAGGTATPPPYLTPHPPAARSVPAEDGILSSKEFYVTALIAGVFLLSLIMQFALLWRVRNLKAEDALRPFSVVLIIMGTLLAITAGFSAAQIAPALGIFGTIAGYLLGRSGQKVNDEKREARNA
jgi:hypothetical protein